MWSITSIPSDSPGRAPSAQSFNRPGRDFQMSCPLIPDLHPFTPRLATLTSPSLWGSPTTTPSSLMGKCQTSQMTLLPTSWGSLHRSYHHLPQLSTFPHCLRCVQSFIDFDYLLTWLWKILVHRPYERLKFTTRSS